MDTATLDGIEIEYEVCGAGEPVLLISPVLADGFVPLVAEAALADRYQLVSYHKRGWVGSTRTPGAVTIDDHVADALGLLDHLGVARAHVVGHSSGAAVAAQLGMDEPERAATITLLELSLLSLPEGQAFLQGATPVLDAYASGDSEGALAMFMSAVSGKDWPTCRTLLEARVPGSVAQAVKDADTFFEVELPGLAAWTFGADDAAAITRPVLSVLGGDTLPLWVEVAAFLRSNVPDLEERTVDGVGHLLHVDDPEPVARVVADFLARHPIA